jgi:Zn-dependent M28 family amino/carboxypeptidase
MFSMHEPKVYTFSDRLSSRAEAIRKEIDIERIRTDLIALPAPRNRLYASEAMILADNMILKGFTDSGWLVEKQPFAFKNILGIADHSPRLVYQPKIYKSLEGVNIIATKKGTDNPEKAIVILAHHDTVHHSPGADDNSASVAALLELARVLKNLKFRYSVILATPDMEELWFIGARALVKTLIASYEILGVINYETMSYTTTRPRTQITPSGLSLLYSEQIRRLRENEFRGDFTCIIYNGAGEQLASMVVSALNHLAGPNTALSLRDPNDIPFIGKVLTGIVPTIRHFSRSDHVLFWKEGIAALQITDTANFRNPHYHQPTDTPEKVDYKRVADIVAATASVIAEVANYSSI